jgi:nucleotide-binding universal stress UspA family protein
MVTKILLPIDGSDYSLKAAKHAIKQARLSGAEIIAVHVLSQLPLGSTAAMKTYYGNIKIANAFRKRAEQEAKKWLSKVERMAKKERVHITTKVLSDGSAVKSIVDFASKKNIGLIVMGTRGRTKFKKLILGSVASGVISHARCPVMVVK